MGDRIVTKRIKENFDEQIRKHAGLEKDAPIALHNGVILEVEDKKGEIVEGGLVFINFVGVSLSDDFSLCSIDFSDMKMVKLHILPIYNKLKGSK